MAATELRPPQLVVNSRMLYVCWVPADPQATAALLPQGLEPAANRAVFMNQYVVDREEQTSHFGAYSLTYMGLDLEGLDAEPGTPGRFWTHYLNSSAGMRAYTQARGVPATPGTTTIELQGDTVVATTFDNDRPVIRSTVRVGTETGSARGHLRYFTRLDGRLMSGRYAYVGEPVTQFEVVKLEFLDPGHSSYTLRPSEPLEITSGFYAPRMSFCYPGGEELL